jgi:hypothetical protein
MPPTPTKKCRLAALFEFVEVGLQARQKHEQDDADLAQFLQQLGILDQPEHRRTEEDPDEQLPEHSRLPQLHADVAGDLRGEQDERQLQDEHDHPSVRAVCRSGQRTLPSLP